MDTVVFEFSLGRVVVHPIPFEEAVQRVAENRPTFWHRRWVEDYPSGSRVSYRLTGTNTRIHTAWKPLLFPASLPKLVKFSQPVKGETGFWFGRPISSAESTRPYTFWWRAQGEHDGYYGKKGLIESLVHYRQLFETGAREYDWAVDLKGQLEYTEAWVRAVALRLPEHPLFAKVTLGEKTVLIRPCGLLGPDSPREGLLPLLNEAIISSVEPRVEAGVEPQESSELIVDSEWDW